ncbi:Nucleoid-associated protein [Trichinella spiralis]|uniref:Nucleoid-associated protein n=1 Tax=Trichinella spiralis TaxID=6334 RepID=A0ABR3KZ50_TRISP
MAFCYVHFVPFKPGKRSNYSLHCVIWSCCSSGGKVILFTGLLAVRRVVNYISALQYEPGNSDTSDVEDHENLYYIHINDQTQRNKQRDSEKLVNMIVDLLCVQLHIT